MRRRRIRRGLTSRTMVAEIVQLFMLHNSKLQKRVSDSPQCVCKMCNSQSTPTVFVYFLLFSPLFLLLLYFLLIYFKLRNEDFNFSVGLVDILQHLKVKGLSLNFVNDEFVIKLSCHNVLKKKKKNYAQVCNTFHRQINRYKSCTQVILLSKFGS